MASISSRWASMTDQAPPRWPGDTRPNFLPGNTAAERHGAYSERRWRPIADQLAAELVNAAPWTVGPAHAPAVAAWARVEAQIKLVADWLDERGPLDEEGLPRPAAMWLDRLESRAQSLRHELGLGPMAMATLLGRLAAARGVEEAQDALDALKAEGRKVLEARGLSS